MLCRSLLRQCTSVTSMTNRRMTASSFSSSGRRLFSTEPKRLGVVGGGQMGYGIAHVAAAQANMDVVVFDISQAQLERSNALSVKLLDKDVSRERITADDKQAILARLNNTTDFDDLKTCDFIVEAVNEDFALKKQIFERLDALMPAEVILASNTSSISISKLASTVSQARAPQVIGMHFFSPVPVMKIVELISGLVTDPATLAATSALAGRMGKTTTSAKDMPGFIANRVLMPYINEAFFCLQEGIATREDIDTTMKLGTAVPMGPLTLADFIGLDTCLSIMRVLHDGFGDSKYRPSPLLVQYVESGRLGRKVGRGVYDY